MSSEGRRRFEEEGRGGRDVNIVLWYDMIMS